MADKTPQEQFEEYKKELGKQYMDGLISDEEYDGLLRAKKEELGLDQPAMVDEKEGLECPSCGALIGEYDTECSICGIALEPVSEPEPDVPKIPDEELGLESVPTTCPHCGAEISEADTVCTMCGNILGAELPAVQEEAVEPQPEIIDDEPLDTEKTCPSCGAFVDADAVECIICDTPLAPSTSETEPEAAGPEEEVVCAGCGAVLEEGAAECFICGQVMPSISSDEPPEIEEAAPEEPDAVEPVPPVEEPEDELAEMESEPEEPEDELAEMESEPEEPEDELAEMESEDEIPETQVVVEEVVLDEGEMLCPSCSSIIPEGSDKCPECWTDFSLYVKCPACGLLTPSGEEACRECFAPMEPETLDTSDIELTDLDVDIPDEVEITEEMKEEMTFLETEEEQGKECLVCGAIFGPDDQACPVCRMEYGVEVEEPQRIDYETWDTMEVAVAPTVYLCPNCGENVTGLEATDREISEGRWFYSGIISIFIGIFFTSFSIWARGVSAENASLGLNPPPTDVLLNVIGWILVMIGFMFWFFSWKLHEEKMECHQCGIEINPGMANCINCGTDITEGEQYAEDPEEEYYEEEIIEDIPEEEYYEEEIIEDIPEEEYDESPEQDEELEVPQEEYYEEDLDEPLEEPVEPEGLGAELPTKHEEHKQCPGCGIFVDMEDPVCPVCDTVFEAVEAEESPEEPEPMPEEPLIEEMAEPEPIPDQDIEIPSEDEELANLGVEVPDEEPEVPEEEPDLLEEPEAPGEELETEEEVPVEPEAPAVEEPDEVVEFACAGCGAVLDESATECFICGAVLEAAPEAPGPEAEEEVEPEAEEVSPEEEATLPDEGVEFMECPSCGAEVEKGNAACPVCEYPLI